jgi:hypothetical protein
MAIKGGKRPGAGRPKGSRNKRTEEQAKAIEESGLTPLDFLTKVYRGEAIGDVIPDLAQRIDAASKAAPYVHQKQPQAHQISGGVALTVKINL